MSSSSVENRENFDFAPQVSILIGGQSICFERRRRFWSVRCKQVNNFQIAEASNMKVFSRQKADSKDFHGLDHEMKADGI